jgi:hypothetical protein
MAPVIKVCRDVAQGTAHMRAQRTEYMPKHPAEELANYESRLRAAPLFNAFARTTEGLTGMVFRDDPTLGEDVPQKINDLIENIDGQGTHLDVFAKTLFEDALEAGHAAIFVDAPIVNVGRELTDEEERMLGVRPYWVHVKAEDIVNWRTARIGGRIVLTQVTLRQRVIEADGEFGEDAVTLYRVLRREVTDDGVHITLELWRQEKDDEQPQRQGAPLPITNVTEIPLVPIYTKRVDVLESRPPLLDLAYTNIAHWNVSADHVYALRLASLPILVLKGVDADSEVPVGPNTALKLPSPDMDAKYAESAFDATAKQLDAFKTDMAALGLNMLQHETRRAETATANRLDKSEQDSALATAARSLQDALEGALAFTAEFMALDEGGSVTVNRDFERLQLTAQDIAAYSQLESNLQITLATLHKVLDEAGALPDDFDSEAEVEELDRGSVMDGEDAAPTVPTTITVPETVP